MRASITLTGAAMLYACALASDVRLGHTRTLQCGSFEFPRCSGPDEQYGGTFSTTVGHGGFGGGACTAVRTPVVFIHGNGDRATNWDSPITGTVAGYPVPRQSVYDYFATRGYNACELFGITYLDREEREAPASNYHRPAKYDILLKFIEAVTRYTRKEQVDVVAHSLGVSMTLAALNYQQAQGRTTDGWRRVRKFVNIAGGLRGLHSCLRAGYANALVPTCGSQNLLNRFIFGFYPDRAGRLTRNEWTGGTGELSMRRAPMYHPAVRVYTVHAGKHDQIHCSTHASAPGCAEGALFDRNANVRAQVNVGAGETVSTAGFDFRDWRPAVRKGGDANGIGHFKAKINTGEILYEMLNTDCSGLGCKGTYRGPVTVDD